MSGRKKRKDSGRRRELEERTVRWLAGFIQKIQLRWAAWMNRHFNRWPRWAQLILASLILLSATAYCIALVTGMVKPGVAFTKGKPAIGVPELAGHVEYVKPLAADDPALKRITAFRKYLDSLGSTDGGKAELDSILRRHPGMMDSLRQVEKMYNQNKKEKNE